MKLFLLNFRAKRRANAPSCRRKLRRTENDASERKPRNELRIGSGQESNLGHRTLLLRLVFVQCCFIMKDLFSDLKVCLKIAKDNIMFFVRERLYSEA